MKVGDIVRVKDEIVDNLDLKVSIGQVVTVPWGIWDMRVWIDGFGLGVNEEDAVLVQEALK